MSIVVKNVLREENSNNEWAWEKTTIHYTIDNAKKIKSQINWLGRGRINGYEAEDIYAEFLLYLYNKEDYNPTIVGSSGTNVTIDGYVSYCVKKFVENYIYKKIKNSNNEKIITIKEEDINLLDIIRDPRTTSDYDEILSESMKLQEALENVQYKRYRYGIDFFNVFFIKLTANGKCDMECEKIFKALGIDNKTLQKFHKSIVKDEELMNVVRLIALDRDAHKKLERMVYGAKAIKNTVNAFINQIG